MSQEMQRLKHAIDQLGAALQFGRDPWPYALEVQNAYLALDKLLGMAHESPRGHPNFCQRCLCELPNHSTSCALLNAIRDRCRVTFYPLGEAWQPDGPSFPIVHHLAKHKDGWAEIVKRITTPNVR